MNGFEIDKAIEYAVKDQEYRDRLIEMASGWDSGLNNKEYKKARVAYWLGREPVPTVHAILKCQASYDDLQTDLDDLDVDLREGKITEEEHDKRVETIVESYDEWKCFYCGWIKTDLRDTCWFKLGDRPGDCGTEEEE